MNKSNLLKISQTLFSERLILRQVSEKDVSDILHLRSNEVVTKFIERPLMKTEKEALAFISARIKDVSENKNYYWGIVLKSNNKLIGTICLWNISEDKKYAEIGYDLHPSCFNKGYMTEAINEVIEFGFSKINLLTIEAFTQYQNLSSIKVLGKNNFVLQSERREENFPKNRIYALKSVDYFIKKVK